MDKDTEHIIEIHTELEQKAEKNYRKNTGKVLGDPYASLIAWDAINKKIKQNGGDDVMDGIYDAWLDYYSPEDETDFKNWFNDSLAIARAKAHSCGKLDFVW